MAFLIGIDEAGYGPNLGPLVIGASVWQIPTGPTAIDLATCLHDVVGIDGRDSTRWTIADSKRVHRPGKLAGSVLETSVRTGLALLNQRPTDWRALWPTTLGTMADEMPKIPWYRDYPGHALTGPTLVDRSEWFERWRATTERAGIALHAYRACAVWTHQFNQRVEQCGTKGALLSETTLDFLAEIVRGLPPEPVWIVCDKHGGRNHYAGLLQPRFGDEWVRVRHESRAESVYELGSRAQPLTITFRVQGDSFLPSALASLMAKYLREQAMIAFNDFWQKQIPDLKPTAGYPVDAKRFKHQISPLQYRLGIADRWLWRNR